MPSREMFEVPLGRETAYKAATHRQYQTLKLIPRFIIAGIQRHSQSCGAMLSEAVSCS